MVFHLSSHSHHNMPHQVTWLFLTKSNGFALSSWLVAASAYNAILCYSKGQPFAIMLSSGFLREYALQFVGLW